MKYCAVCLITKDDNHYLPELAEYHLRIGFDAIVVYDNNSEVPVGKTLAPLIKLGRVQVHPWPMPYAEGAQGAAYNDFMKRYRNEFKWAAVIDADEYIYLQKTSSIKKFLAEFECYGGVAANWLMFGTGGVQKRESPSQIFTFTRAERALKPHVKSIVQPARVRRFDYPHGAEFAPGWFAVTSEHLPLEPQVFCAPCPVEERIRINHYYLRTWEDFEAKAQRKKLLKRRKMPELTPETEAEQYPLENRELADFYAGIKNTPIEAWSEPLRPDSVQGMIAEVSRLLDQREFLAAELLLCECALAFGSDSANYQASCSTIWMTRSIISRLEGDLGRAMHCVREALKFSGSYIVYEELAKVYESLGDGPHAEAALRQANFKKRWLQGPVA